MKYLILAIFLVIVIAVVLAIIAYKRHLKAKAIECGNEAKRFHEKVLEYTAPDHFFTDEELRHLKREFSPVLDTVNMLYENSFISHDFLKELGLTEFLEERKYLNHTQFRHNEKVRKNS